MTLRTLFYLILHQDTLCKNGEGPNECPIAAEEAQEYGTTEMERCRACPITRLDYVRAHSSAGSIVTTILDLDFASGKFHLNIDDLTVEEFRGLQLLAEERSRAQRELEEDRRAKMEMDRAQQGNKVDGRGGLRREIG